jgi:hypothetical protein
MRGLESKGIESNISVNPRYGRKPRPYNIELHRKMGKRCRDSSDG